MAEDQEFVRNHFIRNGSSNYLKLKKKKSFVIRKLHANNFFFG